MEIAIGWLFLSAVVAIIAANRGRSAFGWLLISLVFSPLIGGVLVLALGSPNADPSSDGEHKKCPACAEWVKREAVKCKHCGEQMLPATLAAARGGVVAPSPGSEALGLALGRFVARNRTLVILLSAAAVAWLVFRQVAL